MSYNQVMSKQLQNMPICFIWINESLKKIEKLQLYNSNCLLLLATHKTQGEVSPNNHEARLSIPIAGVTMPGSSMFSEVHSVVGRSTRHGQPVNPFTNVFSFTIR